MQHNTQFYIDGDWVYPTSPAFLDVINPATEAAIARISLGSAADVDLAVKAARRAFPAYAEEFLQVLSGREIASLTGDDDDFGVGIHF